MAASIKFFFEISCVDSTAESILEMTDNAKEIGLTTFKRKCDWRSWASALGYEKGSLPTLENEPHVQFYASSYRGRRCYYAVHSRIEYIFTAKV